MQTVHKYKIVVNQINRIPIKGFQGVLTAIAQHSWNCVDIVLYAIVDTVLPVRQLEVITVGTGNVVPGGYSYLSTFEMGPYIWHVFTRVIE